MSKNARDRRPNLKPVKRVELSEANIKFRWIAIAVLLAVAAVSIGYGISTALSKEPGWQEVTSLASEVNCGGDFTVMYEFGTDGIDPTVQYKKLETLYTELTVTGYRLFNPEAEGTDNLYHVNRHLNEPVSVAPALYNALEKVVESGSRHVFLAPVREFYDSVFLSAADAEAVLYDPMKEPERAGFVQETASFCGSEEMISLELLGENQVRLNVAPNYLAYGEENGIDTWLDLGWMKNAFIADYMADGLAAEGFACGFVASFDGFTRNLDSRGKSFSQNIYHCVQNDVYLPAALEYTGPMSLAALRSYPMADQDRWKYYAYEDGSITSVFLDPVDGMTKTSVDGITAYSRESGCAEIALRLAPVFVAEEFDAYALESLEKEGIQSVRCYGNSIVCTDSEAPFRILDANYDLIISNVE